MLVICSTKNAVIAAAILLSTSIAAIAQSDSRYIKQSPGDQSVIVFIHGIFGDSTSTWKNKNGKYWPDLLAVDPFFSDYDVYVYEYPSRFLGDGFSPDEIAENMRLILDTDHVSDYKDIIFVSHSMGGLVTRAYLNKNRTAANHVRLAYFYSTPTTGSELASIGSLISNNPQLTKMRPMVSGDYLADLQRQWLNINFEIPSFCAYETQSTYGVKVVTQASASNLCNRRLDPINADHIGIVKPAGPHDTPYLALKSAIQQTPPKATIDTTIGVIRPVKTFMSHEEAVKAQGYIGDNQTGIHTAFLRVHFRFLESRFNNAAYFASFDRADANWISSRDQLDNKVRASLLSTTADNGIFTAIVMLKFSALPQTGDRLVVTLGPITNEHVLSDGSFKWELGFFDPGYYHNRIPWTTAFAEVNYEKRRPDWLTITDAQLFSGRDGIALLRATVSNPTHDSRPLLSMIFMASHPRIKNSVSCFAGDQIQTVVLRWQKQNSPERLTAETTLSGVDLPVTINYSFAGFCSEYVLQAIIPLSESIPANTTKIVSLRLKELPQPSFPYIQSKGLNIPPPNPGSILNWPDKSVALRADQGSVIKPDEFQIP